MPSLKEVQNKIVGVKKTSQITKAMNMVAAAKLRGAQQKMINFRPYTAKFNEAMDSLSGNMDAGEFPLMEKRDVETVEIVVVTSDRGLCGSFNSNILKLAEKMKKEFESAGKKVSIVTVGKKAYQILKKSGRVRKYYNDIMGTFQMFNARTIVQDVAANFLEGNADEVHLVYATFKNVAIQTPKSECLLPIQPASHDKDVDAAPDDAIVDYIYEPGPSEIMEVLLPLFLNVRTYSAMLEIGASEHAARMTAMDNATSACSDIITNLTLLYNKARQAGITADLMDIVGGAEALKG
jgi:F-type H+-transporting ATPase subunit gamma